MIAFASLLEEPARQAGIPVPKNSDCFNAEKFPRFELFCKAQLGRAKTSANEHWENELWENAKVIAGLPEEVLKTITPEGLRAAGFQGL